MLRRSVTLGKLALDMIAHRIRKSDTSRRRLIDSLGLAHGLPQKIGQILASTGIDPCSEDYLRLTEGAPSLEATSAFEAIEREWQRAGIRHTIRSAFSEIEDRGIAASLGQVHRARLPDGRAVAVKIQYPNIADDIDSDLRSLGWLTRPVGHLGRLFDEKAYRNEIASRLKNEVDYGTEAAALKRFRALTNTSAVDLVLPDLLPELSTKRVIVTTWIDGARFVDVTRWPKEERGAVAKTLLSIFLKGVFEWGVLHADPHPGNYRFLRRPGAGPQVGLLDFGSIHEVTLAHASALRRGIACARRGSFTREEALNLFLSLDFSSQGLEGLEAHLPAVAQVVFEPFARTSAFDISGWQLSERLACALGPHRMAFRLAGPPGFLFFIRAFQGLNRYLNALKAPLSWSEIYDSLAESIPPSSAQGTVAPSRGGGPQRNRLLSSFLRLRVLEGPTLKVDLTLPSHALYSLSTLVPVQQVPVLKAQGVDVEQVVATALANEGRGGPLLSYQDGEKQVAIWLE